jgi:nicotinate-nucleotide--dimethylbenzimidazole phosphoribosyltransferase
MNLQEAILNIKPINKEAVLLSEKKWDNIVKPLNSMGELELYINKLSGIFETTEFDISKRCLAIMCADNGVVCQGVTQTDSVVTAIVTENFAKQITSVCVMANSIHCDIIPIDIGVNRELKQKGVINRKIMLGTNDMTKCPAMSREQAIKAIEVGIQMAIALKEQGYKLIATGEMGIGNTTTSSAIASILLDKSVEEVTGRGAGLDNDGLERKINAIKKAIEINKPNKDDAIDVLSKVGGLDIAGLVGIFIGGAAVGIPVMLDGFISGISAFIAIMLCPLCKEYMIPSHMSAEHAGLILLKKLGFKPIITAGMRLGEGTGAMTALTVIDMALEVYNKAATFSEVDMDNYVHLS